MRYFGALFNEKGGIIMSNKIKEWRTLLQLSQSEFGKLLCGIPQRTIQSWELGERTPPEWVLGLIKSHIQRELRKVH